jgi:hypothetical protein
VKAHLAFLILLFIISVPDSFTQQQPASAPSSPTTPTVDEWTDDFQATTLDPAKWEKFSFEGAGGGTAEIRNGELFMRGPENSRFGIRSVPKFVSERFIVEAKLPHPPVPNSLPVANAILTVLFDSAGRNRLEWIFRSDGHLEAWRMKDGRSEQLDNRTLATKEKSPMISIARRGDQLMFLLNGEVGLQKKFTDLPREFHVMLYGFSLSENSWNSIRVVTVK